MPSWIRLASSADPWHSQGHSASSMGGIVGTGNCYVLIAFSLESSYNAKPSEGSNSNEQALNSEGKEPV